MGVVRCRIALCAMVVVSVWVSSVVMGADNVGAMDSGGEKFGGNAGLYDGGDVGIIDDYGPESDRDEPEDGFQEGERSLIINHLFTALERFNLEKHRAVEWTKLNDEEKLTLLAKVKVVQEKPTIRDPNPFHPSSNAELLQPFVELIAKQKRTVIEVLLGINLGHYEQLDAEETREATQQLFEAAFASPDLTNGFREVNVEYEKQVAEMKETPNTRIYMDGEGLRAAFRSMLAFMHMRKLGGSKPVDPIVDDATYEGENPFDMLQKAKDDLRDFEEVKRKSTERGEYRPIPDLEWHKRDVDIRSRLVRYERLVRRAESRGHSFE